MGELLGEVDDDEYATLVSLGKMMGDYSAAGAAAGEGEAVAGDTLDDDIGVAVEFENEDEDDEDEEVDEIMVRPVLARVSASRWPLCHILAWSLLHAHDGCIHVPQECNA